MNKCSNRIKYRDVAQSSFTIKYIVFITRIKTTPERLFVYFYQKNISAKNVMLYFRDDKHMNPYHAQSCFKYIYDNIKNISVENTITKRVILFNYY